MRDKILLITFAFIFCQNTFCQVFDNELIDNVSNRSENELRLPQAPLGSPISREINTDMGGSWHEDRKVYDGLSLDELTKIKAHDQNSFDKPFSYESKKTLQGENNIVFLYGFLFIILIIAIVIIIRHFSANEDTKAISENKTIPINGGNNKEKDATKILTELKKLQSLRKTGAITEEEFENLKKGILS